MVFLEILWAVKMKNKWRMVPTIPDLDQIEAGDTAFENGYLREVYKAMVRATPSPWIPLDPAGPKHRLPTREDADIHGDVQVWFERGYANKEHWLWVSGTVESTSIRPSATHWMPALPGPDEYEPVDSK